MHKPMRFVLLLMLVAAGGCLPARRLPVDRQTFSGPRYGWLRKQGVPPGAPAERPVPHQQPIQPGEPVFPAARPGGAEHARATVGAGPQVTASNNGAQVPVASSAFPTKPIAQPAPLPEQAIARAFGDSTDYYGVEPRPWNAKAIAALPVAVATVALAVALQSTGVLLVGGAIAFALGLVGSRQCRDRGNRGKGLALAGMILGAAALFMCMVGLIMAA